MGVRHYDYKIEGVQFLPDSILTVHEHDLLRNFWSAENLTIIKQQHGQKDQLKFGYY